MASGAWLDKRPTDEIHYKSSKTGSESSPLGRRLPGNSVSFCFAMRYGIRRHGLRGEKPHPFLMLRSHGVNSLPPWSGHWLLGGETHGAGRHESALPVCLTRHRNLGRPHEANTAVVRRGGRPPSFFGGGLALAEASGGASQDITPFSRPVHTVL